MSMLAPSAPWATTLATMSEARAVRCAELFRPCMIVSRALRQTRTTAAGKGGAHLRPCPQLGVLSRRADHNPRAVLVGRAEQLRIDGAVVGEGVDRGDQAPVVVAPGVGGVVDVLPVARVRVAVAAGVRPHRVPWSHRGVSQPKEGGMDE